MRLRRLEQSDFRRTRFPLERTVVGTAVAARVTPAPRGRRARQNAFCKRQDALHIEFIELAGVMLDPSERELLAQFLGVAVVDVDVDAPIHFRYATRANRRRVPLGVSLSRSTERRWEDS